MSRNSKRSSSMVPPTILAIAIMVLVATLFKGNFDIREKAFFKPKVNATTSPRKYPDTPKPTPTKRPVSTPTPTTRPATPTPAASACSSVDVSGGEYGGIVNGKSLYYLSSGATVTLKANTTPANAPVNWKVVSFSSALPNGGSFSSNNVYMVKYTAPINTSGADQGVEVRGDISEYPNPWIYCPPITFAIHTRNMPQ